MLIGATLSGLGLLASSFADSVYILYVTFGLLFGFGSSLCYSCSLLILPRYHTTYWSLAHGIALAGNGLGGLGLSPANGILLDEVGIKMGFRVRNKLFIIIFYARSENLIGRNFEMRFCQKISNMPGKIKKFR